MTDQAYDPKDSKFKDLMAGTGSGATRKLKGSDPAFTTRPELMGTFGMVTSTHWLATAAGMAMYERGGNAFDAAVATGFALQVLEPAMNGPAGDVPIILYDAKTDDVKVICGQGTAPAAMTIEKFHELGITEVIPGAGLLPAPVPGAFGAWMLLLREYGTLSLRDVTEHCIGYAKNGFPINHTLHNFINTLADLFTNEWKSSGDVYLRNGVPQPGDLLTNPKLAETYERLIKESESVGGSREKKIDHAVDMFYRGFVAEAIDAFVRKEPVLDNTGRRHYGLITGDDLANWSAEIEEPLSYDYHDYTVYKSNSWSQAPVLLQQLALLKGFDIENMDMLGPDYVHTVTECAKLAFADREKFYGDPKFVDVPFDVLLSDDYNEARRNLVSDQASFDLRPGDVPGYGGDVYFKTQADIDMAATRPAPGFPQEAVVPGETCHVDAGDRHGNLISVTPSGGWCKASPVIPELGFMLGTRAQMFWLEKDKPGSLEPGKRPRTTLTPTFARKEGKPYMAFGTPGGDQQDQWILNFFMRHVHGKMNLQEAIDAPTTRTTHFPSSFYPRLSQPGHVSLESRFPEKTVKELEKRGHKINLTGDWSQGRLTAVTNENGLLRAAANPRFMQTYAFGR